MRALAVFMLCGCTVFVDLENKQCDTTEPRCLPGYQCVAGLCVRGGDGGTGGGGASCPGDTDPAQSACAGTTYYLSPGGSDTADGKSAGAAKRTLTGVTLAAGDVVQLLPGAYAMAPQLGTASGSAACPLLLQGERDGGSVVTTTLQLTSSWVVVRDVTFSPQDEAAVQLENASHVTLQRVTFAAKPATAGFPQGLYVTGTASDCTVRESVFANGDGVRALQADAPMPRFALRGNRIVVNPAAGWDFSGPGIVVEGNDFSGRFSDAVLSATDAPDLRISRNVFHDLRDVYNDKRVIIGGSLTHNTFVGLAGNVGPYIEAAARFEANLVIDATPLLDRAPDAGGYNVFDPTVDAPWPGFDGGTAAVRFDGTTWTPAAGTAAIDGADPAEPVPPGGGARADVGAFERGAARVSDGRYCLPDGGL